ncbi:MAG: hypothetical protein CM15mP78_15690 [Candidatus Poseidoniales archaeon]|nr:MAG: hypothetical protein CM15mP78_15690 [Candidatus Poseidoniales archaeon]
MDERGSRGTVETPMMSTLTLNKDETRTQQFTVFAPASYSEDDADFDLTVYINSQGERATVRSEGAIKKGMFSPSKRPHCHRIGPDVNGPSRTDSRGNAGLLGAPSVSSTSPHPGR